MMVYPYRIKTGEGRFCSQKCLMVWRGPILREKRYQPETHVKRNCEWCGQEFEIPRSWLKNNQGRFCTRSCKGAWSAQTRQNRVSKVETQFAEMLAVNNLVFERHKQIGHFAVDIYFPDACLIVEFDGEYWHSLPRIVEKDARKDAYAAEHGYRILHIPERLFYNDPNATLQMVLDALVA